MSKKKKSKSVAPTPAETHAETQTEAPNETRTEAPPDLAETLDEAQAASTEPPANGSSGILPDDVETTVNLTGDIFSIPGRDDLEATTQTALPESVEKGLSQASRKHLRGLLEALIFASDHRIKANELAKTSSAQLKEVKEILDEMKEEYTSRGVQLEEIAGGWLFRTSPLYAPFVRDLTKRKPVKLSRAQIETLAILAYRQPITRPEIDEIRGVDSGPVLKLLLERDLVRILGKKDEPGRPLLYGTTTYFLEFFGLKAIKDLPTLREFTELNEDSRRIVEQELGETLETVQDAALEADQMAESQDYSGVVRDTLAPPSPGDSSPVSAEAPAGEGGEHDAENGTNDGENETDAEREPE